MSRNDIKKQKVEEVKYPAEEFFPEKDSMTMKVKADKLNFRTRPSKSPHNILRILNKGDEVKVLNKRPDWTKIQFESVTGYVMTEFLE